MPLITSSPYNVPPAPVLDNPTAVQFFDASTQDNNIADVFFKPDGTRMYLNGRGNDTVFEYSVGTPWDMSTVSYTGSPENKFDYNPPEFSAYGLFFKSDGLKMYISGSGDERVYEFDLSTAWQVNTATYLQESPDFGALDAGLNGTWFKPDGTKMYVMAADAPKLMEFDLSVAWDVTTSSFLQNFFPPTITDPKGVFLNADGSKMFLTGFPPDSKVFEYDLGTAWDITSATLKSEFSVTSQMSYPASLFITPDNTKMFVVDAFQDRVHEYNL